MVHFRARVHTPIAAFNLGHITKGHTVGKRDRKKRIIISVVEGPRANVIV